MPAVNSVLVVGGGILNQSNPHDAAAQIMKKIGEAT